MTDISKWGVTATAPFGNAQRSQVAEIFRVIEDGLYEFIIPDWDGGKNRFGPSPGTLGLAEGDDVLAIPTVQGVWFVIFPAAEGGGGGGGGITEEVDPVVGPLLTAHIADTTGVHGIADTAMLILEGDARLTNARTPTAHAASHATGGTDPVSAASIGAATTSALAAHEADTTGIHGIADTTLLVLTSDSRLTDQRTPLDNSVTSAKIVDGTIVPGDIANTTADFVLRGGVGGVPAWGTLFNASIAATAEIAVSKLADGAANDVLVTNADGVTVNWISGLTDAHIASGAAIAQSKILNLVTDLAAKPALGSGTPFSLGTANAGSAVAASHEDHRHPSTSLTPFRGPDGDATAPSLSFNNDNNNGFYLGGTDTIGISTGGAARWLIDSGGSLTAQSTVTITMRQATTDATQLFIGGRASQAQPKFDLLADGMHRWGPGSSTVVDTTLARTAAGVMTLGFVGAATAASFRFNNPTGNPILENYLLLADTQPAFTLQAAGGHRWGPGGSTAYDTTLSRGAAGVLSVANTLWTADGSAAAPAYSFASDPNTGWYRTGADAVALSVGGNAYLTFDATGNMAINGGFLCWTGAAGTPGIAFNSDPDTGFRDSAANELTILTGGTDRLKIDANGDVIIPTARKFVVNGLTADDYTQFALTAKLTGDTGNRVELYPSSLWFGPGNTGTDVGIERPAGVANAMVIWGGGLGTARLRVHDLVTVYNALGAQRAVGFEALASRTTATGAIANTETVILSATLVANLMQAGTTFRIRASGVATAAGATAGSTFRIRIGTTTLTGNIAASLTGTSAVGTAIPWSVEALVTVRTAGAGGTVIGSVAYNANAATGAMNATVKVDQAVATVAVDTTAQKLIELTYISGAAGTSITVHNAVIELVKA